MQNSQVEIDGGFENSNVFSIIEGKNVVHSNFLIRQLYYPARLWEQKIHKPIRPVFMVYSNHIFRLLEYEFTDIEYYNSIKLVQERNYSFEDIEITLEDLHDTWKETSIKPEPKVTFIQADSFHKVISLVENLNESSMTTGEIAELFGFKERQLEYVRLMLEHQIFHELFATMLQIGEVPDKAYVTAKMRELNVCGENLIDRRSSSVGGWLYWILTLAN